MNEFNFFIDVKKYKSNKKNIKKYISILFIMIYLLCFGYLKLKSLKVLENELINLNLEIDNYKELLNKKDEEEEIIINNQTTNINELIYIDKVLMDYKNLDEINYQILKTIKENMTDDLFFTSVTFKENKITIEGFSNSINKIAFYQNQLRNSQYFSDVFIEKIINEYENYKFILIGEIRG